MYEMLRSTRFTNKATYCQVYLDMSYVYIAAVLTPFFLFTKMQKHSATADFDFEEHIEHKEELHNLSGLINEVLSVAQARSTVAVERPDNATMMTIVEVNLSKLLQ